MSALHASKPRIVLLGPPASGKGTQGRVLAEALKLDYLSTGALLRQHVGEGTALGRIAQPILDRGEYLPDDLMCSFLDDWLSCHTGGWVLDGFPRSQVQAGFLDDWLRGRGLKLDAAIYLSAPCDQLLARTRSRVECPHCLWSGHIQEARGADECPGCGGQVVARTDDHEENFMSRHREFLRLTSPLVDYYQQRGVLCPCDAGAPRDVVTSKLLARFIQGPADGVGPDV